MSPKRLLVSFSAGETSAYMTRLILAEWRDRYDEIVVVFANTGQEHEKSLEFVKRCDDELDFGTVWIEAVVHPGERKSPTHRVVDFQSADRAGRVFESMVQKYGIANQAFPHCTRSLKQHPIQSYARSLGWTKYDTAIGIRKDEIDRMNANAEKLGMVYPLVGHWPVTKPEVNAFWRAQPFRLEIPAWQGNCTWCWKKSLRKHLWNIQTTPEVYDFPERMERLYPRVGPEFAKPDVVSQDRVWFRGRQSTAELRALAKEKIVERPTDSNDFDPILDTAGGCGDSCEVFSDMEDIFA